MRKVLRRFTAMSLAICLIFSAVGCGKGDTQDAAAEPEGQKSYAPEYADLGDDITDMTFHYGMQQLGDELCYISYDPDKGQTLEKYSLADGGRTSIPFTWNEPERRQNISRFAFAEDGSIYAIVYQYPEQDSDNTSSAARLLSKFDAQGNQSFAVDISEQLDTESGGTGNLLAVDAQGRIYITGKTGVWLYDVQEGAEPNYRGQVPVCPGEEEESGISSICRGRDGRVYVCCGEGRTLDTDCSLVQIDFENARVGAVYENFPGTRGIALGLEKDFLVSDKDNVYEYDLASQTMEPVLNWMDNNVVGGEVRYFGTLKDGRIYAVTKEWGKDNSGLMLLSRNAGDAHADQREEITLANYYYYYNAGLEKAVADFNKKSDKYRIVLKKYEEYQTMLVDITTNCPDILDLNGLNIEQLAAMGVFEDLNGYLDDSQVLERSDYLENVLEAYTFDGSLVTIPATFSVQTIIASAAGLKEVFGADFEGGWTVEEMMAYADAYPETELFNRLSKSTILYYLLMYGKESFIDRDTGKCSFDSDRFKRVLEFVGRFPDEPAVNPASTAARIEAGEVLLAAASIYRFDGLQLYEEVFRGEAACVGFPTADGSAGCALYTNDALAISASSSHKEGAWEFIEGFLADKAKNDSSDDFVTNRTRLEKNVASALEAEYATYEDGTLVVDKNGNHIITNYIGSTITFEDGWKFVSHPPTDEEVQEVFALIGKAVRRPDQESDVILNIISEEAGAFYQGQKSVDEVADIIQNRVQLYIDEQ